MTVIVSLGRAVEAPLPEAGPPIGLPFRPLRFPPQSPRPRPSAHPHCKSQKGHRNRRIWRLGP